jgi:hypothetical protein
VRQVLGQIALAWLVLPGGDADAHDWYTGKTDPVIHHDCCGNKDCRPIDSNDVRETKDGYFVRLHPIYQNEPQEAEWFIPRERVQAAPDDRYHICERLMTFYRTIIPHMKFEAYQRYKWTCFFAPTGTGSIQPE